MAKAGGRMISVRATQRGFWGPAIGFERLYEPGEEFKVRLDQFSEHWMEKIGPAPKPKAKRKSKAKAKPRPKTGST
jgi:hypothetical protein